MSSPEVKTPIYDFKRFSRSYLDEGVMPTIRDEIKMCLYTITGVVDVGVGYGGNPANGGSRLQGIIAFRDDETNEDVLRESLLKEGETHAWATPAELLTDFRFEVYSDEAQVFEP